MSEEDNRKLDELRKMLPVGVRWIDIEKRVVSVDKLVRLTPRQTTTISTIMERLVRFNGCAGDVEVGAELMAIMRAVNGPSEENRMVVLELALGSCLDGWESWVTNSPTPAESVNQAVLDHITAVRKLIKL